MKPNKNRHLESWTNEILSRANRIRDLIGDKHWLSDGHHKEHLLREFLSRHLPSFYLISRGFVASAEQDSYASREIDVLITDPSSAAPWFNEGGIVIAPPDSIVAHLHVKTTLGKGELIDAFDSIGNVQTICEESESFNQIWKGLFFFAFDQSKTAEEILDLIIVAAKNIKSHSFPDYIVIFGGPLISIEISALGSKNNIIKFRCFDCDKCGMALALADLFGRIATIKNGRKSDWENIIQNSITGKPIIKEIAQ